MSEYARWAKLNWQSHSVVLAVGGISEAGADVRRFEFRKVFQNFRFVCPFRQTVKHVIDGDAEATNDRLAAAYSGDRLNDPLREAATLNLSPRSFAFKTSAVASPVIRSVFLWCPGMTGRIFGLLSRYEDGKVRKCWN